MSYHIIKLNNRVIEHTKYEEIAGTVYLCSNGNASNFPHLYAPHFHFQAVVARQMTLNWFNYIRLNVIISIWGFSVMTYNAVQSYVRFVEVAEEDRI